MLFHQLTDRISVETTIDIMKDSSFCEFSDVALLDGCITEYRVDVLYLGYKEVLHLHAPLPAHCILGTDSRIDDFPEGIDDLAIVPKDSLFSVFNLTRSILAQAEGKGLYEELLHKAEESHSLQAVINASAARLANPLILIDLDFKVIGYSTIRPITDSLWRKNTERGYCSYEFMKTTLSMKELQNPAYPTDSVEVSCTESPYRKLCSRIFFRGAHIGYAVMIASESRLLPAHFSMLATVSQVVSHMLANDFPTLFQQSSQYQKVLYKLLIGASPEELYPDLDMLTFAPYMAALVICPSGYCGSDYLKKHLTQALRQHLFRIHLTYHDNQIVVLLPLENAGDLSSEQLDALRQLAEKEDIKIGISNTFSHIEDFSRQYIQAQSAIRLGTQLSETERIYRYMDYQFYDLLSELPSQTALSKYCHPALALLREYDREHHSDLYHSLQVYLQCGCNIKLAAGKLFIHRNSMIYRLERIEAIGCIDIRNNNTLFSLQISYSIDQYSSTFLFTSPSSRE